SRWMRSRSFLPDARLWGARNRRRLRAIHETSLAVEPVPAHVHQASTRTTPSPAGGDLEASSQPCAVVDGVDAGESPRMGSMSPSPMTTSSSPARDRARLAHARVGEARELSFIMTIRPVRAGFITKHKQLSGLSSTHRYRRRPGGLMS